MAVDRSTGDFSIVFLFDVPRYIVISQYVVLLMPYVFGLFLQ